MKCTWLVRWFYTVEVCIEKSKKAPRFRGMSTICSAAYRWIWIIAMLYSTASKTEPKNILLFSARRLFMVFLFSWVLDELYWWGKNASVYVTFFLSKWIRIRYLSDIYEWIKWWTTDRTSWKKCSFLGGIHRNAFIKLFVWMCMYMEEFYVVLSMHCHYICNVTSSFFNLWFSCLSFLLTCVINSRLFEIELYYHVLQSFKLLLAIISLQRKTFIGKEGSELIIFFYWK